MKMKRLLVFVLSLVITLTMMPLPARTAHAAGSSAGVKAGTDTMRVFHLDCGRKHFSQQQIENLIDKLAENGYNYMELAVGNDGLRFLLDDMSLEYTVSGSTAGAAGSVTRSYNSDSVTAAIKAGNRAYTADSSGELSQAEMDGIISYAKTKGVSIIPLVNSPGHMNAMLSAAKELTGNSNLAYNGSATTIDVSNAEAVAFTQALLQKYIDYFAGKGCTYFNMGADEYANDKYTGGGMGFGQLVSSGKYGKYIEYINAVSEKIKDKGMTPVAFNDGICYGGGRSRLRSTGILS